MSSFASEIDEGLPLDFPDRLPTLYPVHRRFLKNGIELKDLDAFPTPHPVQKLKNRLEVDSTDRLPNFSLVDYRFLRNGLEFNVLDRHGVPYFGIRRFRTTEYGKRPRHYDFDQLYGWHVQATQL